MEKNFLIALNHYLEVYTIVEKQWNLSVNREQIKEIFVILCGNLANVYTEMSDQSNALKYCWMIYLKQIDNDIDYH
jgi:hypothetical protein